MNKEAIMNGKQLKKLLDNKKQVQKLMCANLVLSVCLIVCSSMGKFGDKQIQKFAFSFTGILLSASLYSYAQKYDETEDASLYQANIVKEDFKGELDMGMAINNAVRRESVAPKIYLSLEQEFANNEVARMLALEKRKAQDQHNEDEDTNDSQTTSEQTAFDILSADSSNEENTKNEENTQKINLSDAQFKDIKNLSASIGLYKAIVQVMKIDKDHPNWEDLKEELKQRLH